MIRINLLGDDTVISPSGLWILIGFVLGTCALVVLLILIHTSTLSAIRSLDREASDLQRRLDDIRSTTKEVRELEKKRAELKEKTEVIAFLKRSKRGPVRVLDDLNMALPEKCWVASATEESSKFRISGHCLEEQSVANFMTALEQSTFYSKVELYETVQVEKAGFKLVSFVVDSLIHYAGESAPALPTPTPLVTEVKK